MDVVLEWADELILDKAYAYVFPHPPVPAALSIINSNTTSYPALYSTASAIHDAIAPSSALARDALLRQCISLFTIALVGSTLMYFSFCSLSYYCFFDRRLEHHPRFLKNQIAREIKSSLIAMPTIDLLTLPWFIGEVRGKSMMYDKISDYGWGYWLLSIGLYLFFNDFTIYWIHRLEHHPRIYKYIHKPHHQWLGELCPFRLIVDLIHRQREAEY
jgi:lathosterol oxidase